MNKYLIQRVFEIEYLIVYIDLLLFLFSTALLRNRILAYVIGYTQCQGGAEE